MADDRAKDAGQETWTDVEDAPPDLVEALPIRHGMVLGGRYAIERIIGRGGSGVVVRAHDRDLNQVVAIKIVRAELAGQRVWASRLAREVRLARTISHPHVCRVFDFQQADGRVFLVMELAKGTLRDEIRSGAAKARPLAERIVDARAVASALAAIHAAGIVHRDLSPQNLLRLEDGRLVLSDFGLATESSESTSVHGGTIAYMAPEVMRGEHSTPASDIWSLGALMFEIVFGDKPSWSEGASPEILTPALGRKLTEEERAVLDTCRACTFKDPGKRIPSAAWAERMLAERRRWRLPRLARVRRPIVFGAGLSVLAAVAVGVVRTRTEPSDTYVPATPETRLIIPKGEPADWTDLATVLAEVPDRIHCTRLLQDGRTIRFVWGSPTRAEDLDTVTRKRGPSPLVPAAYAEGCPDLSPDGKRIVFQGHAEDGHSFAFVSNYPDGRNAVPVVRTTEPSMSSEPTWVDGQSFTFDVDTKRMGVYSLSLGNTKVLPEPMLEPFTTSFRFVVGETVFVNAIADSGITDFIGFSWPTLREEVRFRFDDFALDLSGRGRRLYVAASRKARLAEMIGIDRSTFSARRLGRVRDQLVRYPLVVPDGLSFVSIRKASDLFARAGGVTTRITNSGDVLAAVHCGAGLIAVRGTQEGDLNAYHIDRAGKNIGPRIAGPWVVSPGCSPDGATVFYLEGPSWQTKKCGVKGCRVLVERPAQSLAVSPDGKRLTLLSFEARGIVVWVADTETGASHDLSEVENACAPGWASARTVWLPRKRAGKPVWVEVDADSARETGKVVPGSRDCSDGRSDPASPVDPDLRVLYDRTSQLRLARHGLLEGD